MDISLTGVILLSLLIAFVAMVFTVPLAVAMAWLLARKRFPGWHLVNALCFLPLVMPPVITGYILLIGFGPRGPIGRLLEPLGISFAFNWLGAALAAGIMAFPLVMRPIRLAFESEDRSLSQTASTLGAGRWTRFRTISLPLAYPGVLAGAVLGFAKAMGEFGATITFVSNIPDETRTIALAVYSLLQSPAGDAAALNLILIGIGISFAAIIVSEIVAERFQRRGNDDA